MPQGRCWPPRRQRAWAARRHLAAGSSGWSRKQPLASRRGSSAKKLGRAQGRTVQDAGQKSRSDQTKVQWRGSRRAETIIALTRYLLRVYSGAGYHPDRGRRSVSRRHLKRCARALERDGFATQILPLAPLAAPSPERKTRHADAHRLTARRGGVAEGLAPGLPR